MLGGLIVWTVHFFGVYAIASLGEVVSAAHASAWRLAVIAFSGICLALALVLTGWSARRLARSQATDEDRFAPEVATAGAGIAAVAILFQALPAWIGH